MLLYLLQQYPYTFLVPGLYLAISLQKSFEVPVGHFFFYRDKLNAPGLESGPSPSQTTPIMSD